MISNIFNLKTNIEQISQINQNMSDMTYIQHRPESTAIGANFPGSPHYFDFNLSGIEWWIPQRSDFRLRFLLRDNDGNQLVEADDIAPNMGLMANLFQSIEFRINNKVVSRVADYVAQIDMLDKRLNMSKAWLDSPGESSNFYQAEMGKRMSQVITRGTNNSDMYYIYRASAGSDLFGVPLRFLDLVGPNQVAIAANGTLTFTAAAGADIPDLRDYFAIGEILAIDDGAEKIREVTAVTAATVVVSVEEGVLTIVGAANLVAQVRKLPLALKISRRGDAFELKWKPPLSIFRIDHALPAGKYQFVLNPQASNFYKKLAIESNVTDRTPVPDGAGAAVIAASDYTFSVVDFYFNECRIKGIRVDNASYFIDLEEINCHQQDSDNSTSLQSETFTVSPSTYALTLAFQDSRAGTNTLYSPSKFKIENPVFNTELSLSRFYISYAGENRPQPDADPSYKNESSEDYTVERYINSVMYGGTYYESGGCESLEDWKQRGPYYHFMWPKDSTDRSTKVQVRWKFDSATPNGAILLFNHYKKVALIRIEKGEVVDVQIQEM